MKSSVKALARTLLGDYALYQVWTLGSMTAAPSVTTQDMGLTVRQISQSDMDTATDACLHDTAWYLGDESVGFGCFRDHQLIGLVFYWYGQRYEQRRSLPIGNGAAKLVHIVTVPAMRGRGVAARLIAHSAAAMQVYGFHPLYARIWHSNRPSQRAFARAGWRASGFLLQINPLRRAHPWTFYLRR